MDDAVSDGPHLCTANPSASMQVFALVGAVGGALAAGPSVVSLAGGAAAGCALGVLAHVATSQQTGPNQMLEELKSAQ